MVSNFVWYISYESVAISRGLHTGRLVFAWLDYSNGVFVAMHFGTCIEQFPTAFVVGLVFAYWVIQTGSLWPAILGHALNNLIAVTSLHFDVPGFPVSEDLNVVVHNPWWLNVCGPYYWLFDWVVVVLSVGEARRNRSALRRKLNPK